MRAGRLFPLLTAFMAAGMVAACAPAFSQAALDRVDRTVSFKQLQADPDAFRGTWVMAGGIIIETRNTRDGTSVEVLERPLDRHGRPIDTDVSAGRFIIWSPGFLDPAVYPPGKPISVIGEVSGQEVRPLGEMHYRYPVLDAKELHAWEPHSSPRVSFGFGVGVYHHF